MNWKTFIATHTDNTAGNKNTSVFTEAWSPEKIQDQLFQMLTVECGPRHGPFCRRPQQKDSRPPLFQEHRRHFALSKEEVNVSFRDRSNHNSFWSKTIDSHGQMQSSHSNDWYTSWMHTIHRSSWRRSPRQEQSCYLSRFSLFLSSPLASRCSDSSKFKWSLPSDHGVNQQLQPLI